MGMFIGLLGFAIFLIFIVLGFFSLLKKNGKAKISFLLSFIGIFLFFTGLTISALYEQPSTKKQASDTYSTEKTSTSESDTDVSSSATGKNASLESSNTSSSSSEQTKSQDELLAEKLPKNVLCGFRDKSDSKKNSMGGWVIKSRDYVRFWTNDQGIIQSMKLDFRDVPLMADDPDNEEYITDNTADDAAKISNLGNDKYLYHSDKYNLNYQIEFQTNDDGDITLITIFPEQ